MPATTVMYAARMDQRIMMTRRKSFTEESRASIVVIAWVPRKKAANCPLENLPSGWRVSDNLVDMFLPLSVI